MIPVGGKNLKEMAKLFALLRYCINSSSIVRSNHVWNQPSGYNTNIWVFNSSIKRKTELISKQNKTISWYCCGPTVYDSAHIGHACCYIRFDIIRRILEEIFFQNVVLVMGITDIDDKIIQRANDDGVDFKIISQYYEKEFFKEMNLLNIKPPNMTARVTDHIPEIVNFIKKIIKNGYGYTTSDGSVNFSVNKYDGYGVFVGTQEETDHLYYCDKESSRDFALWKGAKPGEPFWPSPWGNGRPGWHIECSAIASKFLGDRLDIHTGGIDLKFPHHENEEAQSCVHHKVKQWVSYWMHSGHVHLGDSVKMSKSLKNTVSINQFLTKYSADHLRMLCLMVPYRNGIHYGDNVMETAVGVFNKFNNFINDCDAYVKGIKQLGSFDESILFQDLNKTREAVLACLADDFDTNSAISYIVQFISRANNAFNERRDLSMERGSHFAVVSASNYIETFLRVCGFTLKQSVVSNSNDLDVNSILEASLQLRSDIRSIALNKNKSISDVADLKLSLLSACDQFRINLNSSGIELKVATNSMHTPLWKT